MSLVGDAVLRVAAAADQSGHLIAFFPACASGAARHDDAGNFKPRYVGNPWRRRVHAHALGDVGTVDPRGDDLDENLARAGLWQRALLRTERLGSARRCDADCSHGGGDRRHWCPYRLARIERACLLAPAGSDNVARTLGPDKSRRRRYVHAPKRRRLWRLSKRTTGRKGSLSMRSARTWRCFRSKSAPIVFPCLMTRWRASKPRSKKNPPPPPPPPPLFN